MNNTRELMMVHCSSDNEVKPDPNLVPVLSQNVGAMAPSLYIACTLLVLVSSERKCACLGVHWLSAVAGDRVACL